MSAIEELSRTFHENGGTLNHVEIKLVGDSTSEYGIFASSHLMGGETIISVPYSLCISAESILSSEQLSCVFEADDFAGLVNYPDEVMAVGIMAALQCEQLPWALHVATMPKSLNSSVFWSDDEIQLLAPSTSFHLTKMLRKQIESDWDSIHLPLSQAFPHLLSQATLEKYTWALSIIYSRAIGFSRGGR